MSVGWAETSRSAHANVPHFDKTVAAKKRTTKKIQIKNSSLVIDHTMADESGLKFDHDRKQRTRKYFLHEGSQLLEVIWIGLLKRKDVSPLQDYRDFLCQEKQILESQPDTRKRRKQ